MVRQNNGLIYKSLFTDETRISLSEAYKDKVSHPSKKKVKVEKIKNYVRLNCWAGITYNGATKLHIHK